MKIKLFNKIPIRIFEPTLIEVCIAAFFFMIAAIALYAYVYLKYLW